MLHEQPHASVTGPSATATLAIIIISYNVRELLRACLAATLASLARSPELAATIWVVDNASADSSAQMVAREFPQVHLIASSVNLGFARSNNLVLQELGLGRQPSEAPPEDEPAVKSAPPRRAAPELILLLNPDTEPLGDAIGQMAAFMREHPAVGGVGPYLLYPDGRFQHSAFRFPDLWQLWFDFFPPRPRRLLESRLNGHYPRALYEAGKPFPVDFVLGAALMVRRPASEAAGLLDEGYFMYAEEVDWCWRIQRAGWPFYCVPAARVIHHGGASARQFRAQSFTNLWQSRYRLYSRFYSRPRRWLAAQMVRLGMWAEVRRARAEALRGQISPDELAERTAAARQIATLFRHGIAREQGNTSKHRV